MCTWDPHFQCSWSAFSTNTAGEEEDGVTTEGNFQNMMFERQMDLYNWIDDLLKSDELQQYFQNKLPKIDADIQCNMSEIVCISDNSEESIVSEEKLTYPLTELFKKKYELMQKINCLLQQIKNKKVQRNQYKSIAKIREKIIEARKLWFCHINERKIERENRRKKVFEYAKKLLQNDLKALNYRSILVDKVIAYQKLKHFQKKTRNQRRTEIIRKIVREFKRQEQIDYERNKTYDYKVKPSGFIMKDLEIVGTRATLFSRYSVEEVEEELKDKIEEEEKPIEKKKGKRKDEDKGKGKKNKEKQSKKEGKKKDKERKQKKDKKGKGKKKELKEEEIVDIEQVLEELKIVLEESQQIKEIKEQYEKEKILKDSVDLPKDYSFCWKPKLLEYRDFEQNNCYKKVITILNCSAYVRKFRFFKIIWDPPWDPPIMDVELTGIQKVYPGLSVTINITFNPLNRDYLLTGNIYFLSYAPKSAYNCFGIPFICTPFAPDIKLSTNEVEFPKMPIWRAKELYQNNKGKKIIFTNFGTKKCSVSITKVHDPLEIEAEWDKIKPKEAVEEEIQEDIREVDKKPTKVKKDKSKGKEGKQKSKKKEGKDKKKKKESKKDSKKENSKKSKKKDKGNKGKSDDKARKKKEAELEAQILQDLLDFYMPQPVVNIESHEEIVKSPSQEIKEIVHECVENAFNVFVFDNCCFTLEPKSRKIITVYFKNVDYAGYYYEKYIVKFFEETYGQDFLSIGIKEINVHAEVTGNFITVSPIVLDFGVCVFDSIYQLQLEVHNSASISHGLTMKLPSSLKKYLYTNCNDFYVPAGITRFMFLRFLPKKELFSENCRYLNLTTSVIEFPVYVTVVSKNFLDTPPVQVTVYAILTKCDGLTLHPEDIEYTEVNENKEYVLDLGECSTKETVYADLEIINNSLAVQHFGFLDLPESVIISPNYGYGIIMPLESKKITLMFSPEAKDIPNYFLEGESSHGDVIFPISIETVKYKGGVKESRNLKIDSRFLRRSVEILESELDRDNTSQLYQEIVCCLHQMNDSHFLSKFSSIITSNISNSNPLSLVDLRQLENEENNGSTTSYKLVAESNKLWLMAKIINPYCDFSHQFVRFPDTPCGSYSISCIDLRNFSRQAFNSGCVCGYINRNTKAIIPKCSIKFEIIGESSEITIEPFCGHLDVDDEKKKLYLVAKPEVPQEIVEQKAKAIKKQKIIDQKIQAILEKRQAELMAKLAKEKGKKGKEKKEKGKNEKEKKGEKKTKKDKKNKDKSNTKSDKSESEPDQPPPSTVVVKDEDVKINFFDLYSAEMVLWRDFEPYELTTHFICNVQYNCSHRNSRRDPMYITCSILLRIARKGCNNNIAVTVSTPTPGTKALTGSELDLQTIRFISVCFVIHCQSGLLSVDNKTTDTLYLDAICKVIRPDFTHNLQQQRINFGNLAIGMSTKKVISIQNIQHVPIKPRISVLNPVGPFSTPFPNNLTLESEHVLNIPIYFAPTQVKQEIEYFEIAAGRTVCTFTLNGEGVFPTIRFIPDFVVCRLETPKGNFTEFNIDIENKSNAAIAINFVKTCELEGTVKEIETAKKEETKKKKDKASKASKTGKTPKYSHDLTKNEIYSLQNFFEERNDNVPLFDVQSKDDLPNINPNSKKSWKIRFGVLPKPVKKEVIPGKKDKGKKDKGKEKKKGKEKTCPPPKGTETVYVSKFNILLGNSTVIKDIIVIAKFCK